MINNVRGGCVNITSCWHAITHTDCDCICLHSTPPIDNTSSLWADSWRTDALSKSNCWTMESTLQLVLRLCCSRKIITLEVESSDIGVHSSLSPSLAWQYADSHQDLDWEDHHSQGQIVRHLQMVSHQLS